MAVEESDTLTDDKIRVNKIVRNNLRVRLGGRRAQAHVRLLGDHLAVHNVRARICDLERHLMLTLRHTRKVGNRNSCHLRDACAHWRCDNLYLDMNEADGCENVAGPCKGCMGGCWRFWSARSRSRTRSSSQLTPEL